MQALILAGGRGMRLNPLTNDLPASLLYLPGGTILDYLLQHLSELPIEKTALILQYRGDQVARHLAERYSEPFTLTPQYPPFTFLSALASAAPWVEGPTLVLHGNFYFSHNLHYFLEAADPSRPTFLLKPEAIDRGCIGSAGAYLLPPKAFYLAARFVEEDSLDTLREALMAEGIQPATVPLQGWAQPIHTSTD
ncbi:MAG: sugar phosphate nucleotidyltransferase, partial [Chloroflexota bacterium]|nr:sugar phosphate nucleotidyltransferase [Chloroflexota bacterium]